MRIVVAGAGKLGYSIAELLADDLNASMKGWGTDEAAIESIINNPDLIYFKNFKIFAELLKNLKILILWFHL